MNVQELESQKARRMAELAAIATDALEYIESTYSTSRQEIMAEIARRFGIELVRFHEFGHDLLGYTGESNWNPLHLRGNDFIGFISGLQARAESRIYWDIEIQIQDARRLLPSEPLRTRKMCAKCGCLSTQCSICPPGHIIDAAVTGEDFPLGPDTPKAEVHSAEIVSAKIIRYEGADENQCGMYWFDKGFRLLLDGFLSVEFFLNEEDARLHLENRVVIL